MKRVATRPGVLILGPSVARREWTVVEVDATALDALRVPAAESESARGFASVAAALDAAYDLLTLMVEGRAPMRHEHVQESVRDFVRMLEDRGYDRESAVDLLLRMVDTMSARSPVPAKGRERRRVMGRPGK